VPYTTPNVLELTVDSPAIADLALTDAECRDKIDTNPRRAPVVPSGRAPATASSVRVRYHRLAGTSPRSSSSPQTPSTPRKTKRRARPSVSSLRRREPVQWTKPEVVCTASASGNDIDLKRTESQGRHVHRGSQRTRKLGLPREGQESKCRSAE
jgi:hypothetical protein